MRALVAAVLAVAILGPGCVVVPAGHRHSEMSARRCPAGHRWSDGRCHATGKGHDPAKHGR